MPHIMTLYALMLAALGAPIINAREWHDASGKYSVEADLIASSDKQVVLKRNDGKLVVIEKSQLSVVDREYLRSKDGAEQNRRSELQTWTMRSGWKVTGRIVAYGRKEIVIQRRRGKIYVNDRLFANLPEIYQRMVPRIVSHFEGVELEDEKAFVEWVTQQKGEVRKFVCDGVMLELESGDEYAVPFFFFSEDDLKVLQPGWQSWLASNENTDRRYREDFLLQAQAEAYQRDRLANQQIAAMQLILSAVDAGVTDLWEVYLLPKAGVAARPQIVVVPARDSQQAIASALSKNPQHVAGPARKLN